MGNPYKEITKPAGFVNTEGITLKELVNKKVILVDFMTYSCINCQRTFPYLNAWYEKYKDLGLEIVGIHTPEFAFEKNIDNVREAMVRFGIMHPVVLDNDYATWRAYGNNYWPRKYLIDINGNIVYDHIGEGNYEETEMKIRELLDERAEVLGEQKVKGTAGNELLVASMLTETKVASKSPETYFGSSRNEYLKNGTPGTHGQKSFTLPNTISPNALYLGGTWNIDSEYAESVSDARVIYKYNAKEVYIVADADTPVEVEIFQDGKLVGTATGADVNTNGVVIMKESRLYKLILNPEPGEHMLELRVKSGGLRLYAFTFG
jgi:thiol-disulfide isomerase/thioredoxin